MHLLQEIHEEHFFLRSKVDDLWTEIDVICVDKKLKEEKKKRGFFKKVFGRKLDTDYCPTIGKELNKLGFYKQD